MTRAAYRRRVKALSRRYPYLFGATPLGISIAPGWLAIVARLCARIDAVLDPAEKSRVRIVQIKEKLGGLRVYWDSRPTPPGTDESDTAVPGRGERAASVAARSLYDRLAPPVRAAEKASYAACLFCGAPGRLRHDRPWILTLCDRHSSYTYHHLDVAFEQMTDPDREVAPPRREAVIAALRAAADAFRAHGITRLGLLPPRSAAGIWRLVVARETGAEAVCLAEARLHWPFEVEYGGHGEDRTTHAEAVTWLIGERR